MVPAPGNSKIIEKSISGEWLRIFKCREVFLIFIQMIFITIITKVFLPIRYLVLHSVFP